MAFKSNHPYVFVNGLFGYGPESLIYGYMPYFGSAEGSLIKLMNEKGFYACEASAGPLSSAWDRACELYAMLVGGKVDYGKAHSEKYGHARYGRSFEKPLVSGWGRPDESGKPRKINLVGHSFGGTTARLLACLLYSGCEAERKASEGSELSPLFEGGHTGLIHSITTCASPHNGMTLFDSMGEFGEKVEYASFNLANFFANTPISEFYDCRLDQFGLTRAPGSTAKVSRDKAKALSVKNSKDNAFYDLSIKGAAELNAHLFCVPDIYYFSYSAKKTKKELAGRYHKAIKDTWLPYMITSSYIGHYDIDLNRGIKLDSRWFENDGIVNSYSALAPLGEPATAVATAKVLRTGIWYKMGTLDMAHTEFCGHRTDKRAIDAFYLKHAAAVNSL